MSARDHQAVLDLLPRWFPAAVRWSVDLANHGPRWMPRTLKCAPLWCAGVAVRVAVDHVQSHPGYGVQPHGSEAKLAPSGAAGTPQPVPQGWPSSRDAGPGEPLAGAARHAEPCPTEPKKFTAI